VVEFGGADLGIVEHVIAVLVMTSGKDSIFALRFFSATGKNYSTAPRQAPGLRNAAVPNG
jgi:hypothetical protein